MAYAWRGTSLIIEKSHLRVRAVRLRHPLSRQILHSHNSHKDAVSYCRLNGYTWMKPVSEMDMAAREQRL